MFKNPTKKMHERYPKVSLKFGNEKIKFYTTTRTFKVNNISTDIFMRWGGPRSVMAKTPDSHAGGPGVSNPGAAPPTLEPISPIRRLQVAKMRQGSQKGWCM